MERAQRPPRRARGAVSTIFFVNGVVLASWVPHIPAVKDQHALGDGRLGLVLLCMAAGAVLALPPAGWLVERFGSRAMTSTAALAFCLTLPLPVLSPSVMLVALSLTFFGACNATLDVSMNAQAVAIERRYGRAIMSSFHALFSLGGVAGAVLAGLTMWLGVTPAWHVVATGLLCAGIVICMIGSFVPSERRGAGAPPVFVRPSRALLSLGLLAFCGLLAEGAMADWSAVYLRDLLGTSPAVAAAGFAAFSLTMASGRFCGDRLVGRFGSRRLLRLSSAVAAAGLGVALVVGVPAVAIAGFAAVGLGIANIVPLLFSSAGRVAGVPTGVALAAVATTGYFGFLAGPPLIGLVSEATNLAVALGIVSVCCVLVAARAAEVPPDLEHELTPVKDAEVAAGGR